MLPLEGELPGGHRYLFCGRWTCSDPTPIEAIPSAVGLIRHAVQVRAHRPERIAGLAEALQLGMAPVALSLAAKNRLREQGLAPARNKALTVQVAGVKGPHSHD